MEYEKFCEFGLHVIEIEAKMIANLTKRIDQCFALACQILLDCRGRIIVMGVGKSGHIAKKIAATFASTGSPSFFIHPSEARHGDMGMMTKQDALVILSNSGESEEIVSLLPNIKHLGIALIALTGKPHSRLAQAATVHLDVSVEKEACPLGLAPTSSTTAALVMGDALAMALLKQRGLTQHDFALSHPGGTLGRRLTLRVNEIMHQHHAMPIVSVHARLKEAVIVMTEKKLGMAIVVDDAGGLLGVLTDGDLRRALDSASDIAKIHVRDIMSAHPKTITGDTLAAEALHLMETHKITSLIAVDDASKPAGVIHIHDILRAGVI
jgi:arabinose-5-phosphate isomerase